MPSRPLPFLIAFVLADASPRPDPAWWRAQAQGAESAGVDLLTVDAGPADSVMVAAAIAAATTRIGIVPAAAATTTEPFHVSTSIATVDQVAGGRAGWLAEVIDAPTARGLVTWAVPDDTDADAGEHIAAVRALWDSWEEGAEIRDAATARFIDSGRVHHVDVRGEHVAVRGPSITPRPPQGHPPVFLRVGGDGAGGLARAHAEADVLLVAEGSSLVEDAGGAVQLLELAAGPELAGRLAAAEGAGFAGVLVRSDALPATLDALAPALAARDQPAPGATLRERLGLPAATNRFTAARA